MAGRVRLDTWAAVALICGAIVGVEEVWRKVVRPVFRYIRRTFRRINTHADEFLGDPAKGIPGVPKRLSDVEERLGHVERGLTDVQTTLGKPLPVRPDSGSARRDPNGVQPRRRS